MALIDFDKFLASFITAMKECNRMRTFSIPVCIKKALEEQGLEYKDGEIVKSQRRVSAEAKENGYSESEDERIRMTLIENFKFFGGDFLETSKWGKDDDLLITDIIAWLEKQGQKPNPVLDIEIPFGAKDSELQEATYLIPEGFHAEIEGDKVVIKKGKQKSAWSKEDEWKFSDILALLRGGENCHYNTPDLFDWFKSLKNRIKGG